MTSTIVFLVVSINTFDKTATTIPLLSVFLIRGFIKFTSQWRLAFFDYNTYRVWSKAMLKQMAALVFCSPHALKVSKSLGVYRSRRRAIADSSLVGKGLSRIHKWIRARCWLALSFFNAVLTHVNVYQSFFFHDRKGNKSRREI